MTTERAVLHADSWAPKTIDAVLKFTDDSPDHRDHLAVERIAIEGPEQFSILFEVPGRKGIFGLRLRSDMSIDEMDGLVEDGSALPFARATPEDNGFDIVTRLLTDPFDDEDTSDPDDAGVRWLKLHAGEYFHHESWLRRVARREKSDKNGKSRKTH